MNQIPTSQPTSPSSESAQPSEITPLTENSSNPTPLWVALQPYSRQQKRLYLRKGYQAQLRDMGAPLSRQETRLIANSTSKILLNMLNEQAAGVS